MRSRRSAGREGEPIPLSAPAATGFPSVSIDVPLCSKGFLSARPRSLETRTIWGIENGHQLAVMAALVHVVHI